LIDGAELDLISVDGVLKLEYCEREGEAEMDLYGLVEIGKI
jgi:hypothetical protein